MIVRIIGLVLLFIIRTREKSIADIIRNWSSEAYVKKKIQRLEKCNFKLRKFHLDLRFLFDCKKNRIVPKFLCFKLSNRYLKRSHVYKKRQIRPVGTGRKLSMHKTFRRRPRCLLNVLCMFNLSHVSTGDCWK